MTGKVYRMARTEGRLQLRTLYDLELGSQSDGKWEVFDIFHQKAATHQTTYVNPHRLPLDETPLYYHCSRNHPSAAIVWNWSVGIASLNSSEKTRRTTGIDIGDGPKGGVRHSTTWRYIPGSPIRLSPRRSTCSGKRRASPVVNLSVAHHGAAVRRNLDRGA